jgi:hypothetical protein
MDSRAQVSAELLIVIAAMAALALFLIDKMQASAQKMGKSYDSTTDKLEDAINKLGDTK